MTEKFDFEQALKALKGDKLWQIGWKWMDKWVWLWHPVIGWNWRYKWLAASAHTR